MLWAEQTPHSWALCRAALGFGVICSSDTGPHGCEVEGNVPTLCQAAICPFTVHYILLSWRLSHRLHLLPHELPQSGLWPWDTQPDALGAGAAARHGAARGTARGSAHGSGRGSAELHRGTPVWICVQKFRNTSSIFMQLFSPYFKL